MERDVNVGVGDRLNQVEAWVKANTVSDDPGHDFAHLTRVVNMARHIGERMSANLEVLLPAAYLHDVVNVPKNHPDRLRASQMAAIKAKALLLEMGYSATEQEQIAQAILEHSYSAGHKASSLESAILQDADRLDALGAVGIMRTVSCGALMKASYYHLEEPVAQTRALDDKSYTLDHFYVKLFKLADRMNTPVAQELARRRVQFMNDFVAQLSKEIQGQ